MSHEMCFGEVAERSIAAGCKPAAFGLRRFEPSPPHHSTRPCGPRSWRANAGASEWCPERAERSSESKGDDVCFGGKRRFTPRRRRVVRNGGCAPPWREKAKR